MTFLGEAQALQEQLSSWRRHLHQHPEVAYEEVETARLVEEALRGFGIDVKSGVGKTGVVGFIEGKALGPTIALRADMDALPIQDGKSVSYTSSIPGKAHLCGHDAHTTMLLGAAQLLSRHPPENGNVKLVFQPAEEGGAGAKAMIEDGVLSSPEVSAIFGIHVHHSLEVGHLSVCPGQSSAASDAFDLTIIGEGGHAAHPHLSVDAIVVASEIVTALQQLVSRQTNPLQPLVITVGKIEGGYARNVIAPSVRLEATIRTLHVEVRERVPELLKRLVKGVCDAFGATYKLSYRHGYPSVHNHPSLVPVLREAVGKMLDTKQLTLREPSMGGEDFAFYTQKIPGLICRLGIRNETKETVYPLHHPMFDIDESALPLGSALHALFACTYLNNK